jgi:hypothetical protein
MTAELSGSLPRETLEAQDVAIEARAIAEDLGIVREGSLVQLRLAEMDMDEEVDLARGVYEQIVAISGHSEVLVLGVKAGSEVVLDTFLAGRLPDWLTRMSMLVPLSDAIDEADEILLEVVRAVGLTKLAERYESIRRGERTCRRRLRLLTALSLRLRRIA